MDENKLFQVSVKGMYFNEEKKLMMVQEKNGLWELPGGRVERGEDLIDALFREVHEETGLTCEILDKQPYIAYATIGEDNFPRLMLFYKIRFDSLRFTPSSECVALQFYSKEEMKNLRVITQLKKLQTYL